MPQASRAAAEPLDRESDEARPGTPSPRGIPTWVPLVLLFAILAKLALRAAGPIYDPDTWWHLRLGEEFRGGWSLADPGQLSPFATKPWFATQWTLELVASYLEQAFGLGGVAWLAGVGVVVLGITVYLVCRSEASVLPAVLATGAALLGASSSLGPRPQLASFILAGVVTAAWLRTERDLKPRWWLIPLTWLWACTHGMWVLAVLIGLAVAVGLWLDRRVTRSELLRLLAVPALCLLAALATPVGPKLILAPLGQNDVAGIDEWQPTDFKTSAAAVTALMLVAVAVTWSRGSRPAPWPRILLLVMAAGWTVLAFRTVALGAVISAPLLAAAVQTWLPSRGDDPPTPGERRLLVSATAACLVALALVIPTRPAVGVQVPQELDSALEILPEGTVVYNDYALGGWLEWRHRNVAPVIDGMLDAYPPDYVADYVASARMTAGWSDFIDRTGAEYALLDLDSPMVADLVDHLDWQEVAVDEDAEYVLLRAPAE